MHLYSFESTASNGMISGKVRPYRRKPFGPLFVSKTPYMSSVRCIPRLLPTSVCWSFTSLLHCFTYSSVKPSSFINQGSNTRSPVVGRSSGTFIPALYVSGEGFKRGVGKGYHLLPLACKTVVRQCLFCPNHLILRSIHHSHPRKWSMVWSCA